LWHGKNLFLKLDGLMRIVLISVFISVFQALSLSMSASENFSLKGFEENKGQFLDQHGQVNTDVLFLNKGRELNMQLRKNGFSYEFFAHDSVELNLAKGNKSSHVSTRVHRIDYTFEGERPAGFSVEKGISSSAGLNYYTGGDPVTGVKCFQSVTYKEVFPFVDIVFYNAEGNKYDIILHPGADINSVKFLYRGADGGIIMEGAGFRFGTSLGCLEEKIPVSYYKESPGKYVRVNYEVSENSISFTGEYDGSKTLVIDPVSDRIWGTYYGDASLEYCQGITRDALNNVYICGYTLSTSNVATNGTYQNVLSGSFDAYIAAFDQNGVRLWGTYFGGPDVDVAHAIICDGTGAVYIAGDTFSTSNVATVGSHQQTYGGGIDDAFLARFDMNGQLIWATYYGGTLHDIVQAVTLDINGDVIICGHTESLTNISTVNAFQPTLAGDYDIFIVKFNSAGVRQWGTYFGGSLTDESYGVKTNSTGDIFICGMSNSMSGITTINAFQPFLNGISDAVAARFNSAGTNLIWATYFGGGGTETGTALVIDNSDQVYVSGTTTSSANIASTGAYQSAPGSADDAFLVKFTPGGSRTWSTYVGGNDVDYIYGITLRNNKDIFITGSTQSTNAVSTPDAYQPAITTTNNYDAFISSYDTSGFKLNGTYYGGSGGEEGRGIICDANSIFVCGNTNSIDSIATQGSFMPNAGGSGDAFLARFCMVNKPSINPPDTVMCKGDSLVISTDPGMPSYLWSEGSTTAQIILNDTLLATYFFSVEVADGLGCSNRSDTTSIDVIDCGIGFNELELSSIILFPNPSNEFVLISGENINWSETEIFLMTNSGQRIDVQRLTSGKYSKIVITDLAAGIYFLALRNDQYSIVKKLVKY
jgi:hypothetical protein